MGFEYVISFMDIIVVSKVDRLTRSHADLAEPAESLQDHRVSNVAAVQSFNATRAWGG